jgi:hypothetical protein
VRESESGVRGRATHRDGEEKVESGRPVIGWVLGRRPTDTLPPVSTTTESSKDAKPHLEGRQGPGVWGRITVF